MMLDKLLGIMEPVTRLIDDLNTSDEERLTIKSEMLKMQNSLSVSVLEHEAKIIESKAKIIAAEAQGQSWLQRNWRPITMLTFLMLVVCDTFGWTEFRLAPEAWTLLQLGLGGYVIGRSAEKVLPAAIKAVKN